jgi:dolichol-phosphate mannosyltransferase
MHYSIVVPALNEEETIGEILLALRDMADDLLVVDGHSSDRTVAIAQEYGARVIQDNGLGKGDAVRVGLANTRCPITVFIDADGSHDPDDIPKLVAPIMADEADLVMGSRMLGGSEELFGSISEVVRLMGSLAISLTINYRYGVRLTDYQNGFRAIRTEVGRAIGLSSNITTIEQEMAMKCLRYGYRVLEVPTHEYRRKGGVSKIRVMRVAHIYIGNLLSNVLVPSKRRLSAASPRGLALPHDPLDAPDPAVPVPRVNPASSRPCSELAFRRERSVSGMTLDGDQ